MTLRIDPHEVDAGEIDLAGGCQRVEATSHDLNGNTLQLVAEFRSGRL